MTGRTRGVATTLAVSSLVAALSAMPAALPQQDEQPPTDPLAADIDEILDDSRMDGSQVSVVVAEAQTGDVLYERQGDHRLMPASNQKLLTSAVAMERLGPEYTFTTTVRTDARQAGRVLAGDLYLRGTGDPTMLAEDYEALADAIADAGIQRVHGAVVADDTWFDDVRLGLGWNWDDEPYYYSAQISALTLAPDTDYDAGTVIVEVEPGASPGAEPQVSVIPENDYVEIVNKARTTDAGTGRDIGIERERGTNTIRITGTIATDGGQARAWRTVWEPTGLAAHVFHDALEERGVRVREGVELGATPDDTRVLASHESMPLRELLVPFMKLSNNGHAEVLMKAMGQQHSGAGTWSAGRAAMAETLREWKVDPDTMAIADGSGLSRRNWVPPNQLITLLRVVQEEPWYDDWYDALPVAGVQERFVGGTLRYRMNGTAAAGNAHAKTGTLTGATGLSGYVTTADGADLVFSILLNNYLSGKPSDLEDQIVVRLAEHTSDGEPAPSTLRVPAPAVELPDDVECSWTKAC